LHFWIRIISCSLKLSLKTYELSILIIDEFITYCTINSFSPSDKFKLDDYLYESVIAAINLAIKTEERFCLEYRELQNIIDKPRIDDQLFIEREFEIIAAVKWNLNKPTASEISKLILLISNPEYDFNQIFERIEQYI